MKTVYKTIGLHQAQADFRRSDAIYRGFVGGRGAGKSWVGAYDLLRRAKPKRTYLVGSPTGTILGDTTFPTFEALAKDLGVWRSVRTSPWPTVSLAQGIKVRFRTAEDPEKMRGPNLSGIWLDEASLMAREAYEICIASLREAGEQGWLSATFTPKGCTHWTYEVFGKGRPNTALFQARTGDNPFNPAGFEATLAAEYAPRRARQELGGEFLDLDGAEWPAAWFPESIWFDDWPTSGVTLRIISLDPSKGKNESSDYSAFAMLARDKDGRLWVEADIERRPTTQIVADGFALCERFQRETAGHLDGFGIESNSFQELLADLFITQGRLAGFMPPIYKINNTTGGGADKPRIRRLTPELKSGNFRFRRTPGTRLLVKQMLEYPGKDGSGKSLADYHDDGPDALEMARRLGIEIFNGKPKR